MAERILVTGALGCIGAWVVGELMKEGAEPIAFDSGGNDHRLRLAMPPEVARDVPMIRGDVREISAIEDALDRFQITHVIHLAALQVPFCAADPVLGAQVNVVGTTSILEACRRRPDQIRGVAYASSVAIFDRVDGGAAGEGGTLYGAYKRCNEETARVYWHDYGLASVGLRPYVVYGPGRDQGVTSAPTQAMHAAARGEPFAIGYGGRSHMQYVADVAQAFISAARHCEHGAVVLNLGGTVVEMSEVVAAIEHVVPEAAGTITFADNPLPFPAEVAVDRDVVPLPDDTALIDGVRETIERFRRDLADTATAPSV